MSPERWQRIEALCQAALDRLKDERGAFLEQACAGDDALRAEVESLLAAYDKDPSFLEEPVAQIAPPPEQAEGGAVEDARVGPYRLIRSLGRGGMGQVYLAVRADETFTQYVAVKVIRRGLDTDDLLRRFYAERQILASLNHPNIARLFDGGTTEQGRPYFVMEYVEGVPMIDYCDAHRLSIDMRLRLFRQVCAAVHHAHQNLVVHRDLKPSNILVTPDGMPKLLDFGIAKLLDPERSSYSIPMTRTEQRLLTPEYASPEQVRGGTITTASDVYALGVLLYELLTGRRPYRLPARLQHEFERIICEEKPMRPSTAVTEVEEIPLADDATQTITPEAVSQARSTQVDRLRRRLAGDLDTIVLMAMRKEPERRYGSAEQLANDVQRHLKGLPVLAQPDTLAYRAQKFVRRHRWGVLSAAVIAVLLVGATTGMAIQSAQIRAQAAEVAAERDRAEQVADFLMEVFGASDPAEARGDTLTAPALLARGAERVETELADQPARQADMLGVISEVYFNLGRFEEAEALARRALDLRQQVYGPEHAEVARSLSLLGSVLTNQGQYDEAEPLYRETLAQSRKLLPAAHPDLALRIRNLGHLLYLRGNYDEAEPLYREALAMRQELLGPDHADVAKSLSTLGVLLREQGRYEEAEPLYREALAIQRRALGEDHPEVATTLNNLAVVLRDKGDLPGAEAQLREVLALRRDVLGPDHPEVGTALNNLAVLLREQGKYEEAEPFYREALDLHRRTLGDEHPTVAISLNNLGRLLREKGDDVAAEQYYREALAMRRKLLGEAHPAVAVSLNNLASVLRDQDAFAEAEKTFQDALAILRSALGEDHPNVAIVLNNLARTYYLRDQYADAERTYRTALATYRSTLPADHPRATGAMIGLGRVLVERDQPEEAQAVLEQAVTIRQQQYGSTDVRTAEARTTLGLCLAALGRQESAATLLEESLAILDAEPDADQHLIIQARAALNTLNEPQAQ